jgi:hypothetical protein
VAPLSDKNVAMLESGSEHFTVEDLYELSSLVSQAWMSAADRDWSVHAGTLEWSCMRTADHAVDCVYAPVFFLASQRTDAYPDVGLDLTLGDRATPALLVQSLGIATHMLAGVVNDADPDVRAIIFRRPGMLVGAPADFIPRAGMELILHAHDVCAGLAVPFEPPQALARRLREHTRPWPMWGGSIVWGVLQGTEDPWGDLLSASGRHR